MNGERLARVSLALDAVYCGLMGLLIIVLRARIGGLVRLPALLIGAIGAAIVGWAYVVLGQTARIDWRKGVKQTLSANVVGVRAAGARSGAPPGPRGARAAGLPRPRGHVLRRGPGPLARARPSPGLTLRRSRSLVTPVATAPGRASDEAASLVRLAVSWAGFATWRVSTLSRGRLFAMNAGSGPVRLGCLHARPRDEYRYALWMTWWTVAQVRAVPSHEPGACLLKRSVQ